MDSKLEDTVNEAIEFFPGRVKRDQWAAQAKALLEGGGKTFKQFRFKEDEKGRIGRFSRLNGSRHIGNQG